MEALLRELWQLREIQELAQLMESGGGPALGDAALPAEQGKRARKIFSHVSFLLYPIFSQ